MSHLPVRPARQARRSRTLRRVHAGVLVVLVAGGLLAPPAAGQPVPTGATAGADRSSASTGTEPVVADGGPTGGPLTFEENRGQFADEVAFAARRGQAAVSLTRSAEMVMGLPDGASVAMRLVGGADQPAVAGRDRAAGQTNYLRGDPDEWVRGVGSYREVVYEQVYAGIDLVVQASEDGWPRYDFQLEPGADPSAIRLGFAGADGLAVDDDGDLRLDAAGGGEIVQRRPFAYQRVDGEQREVAAEFAVLDDSTVAFELGDYDPSRPLVIDPEVEFSTYVGGIRQDRVTGVATNADGNSYAVGWTESIDLPTTDEAYQTAMPGSDSDDDPSKSAFVVKYAPDGSIAYATYLGGTDNDEARAVAVDAAGRAHVIGHTHSDDFPTTDNAYQPEPSAETDAFVARLSADGADLEYGTYFASLGQNGAAGTIAVDDDGHVAVGGITDSDDFPATDHAYEDERQGGTDVFVAVFDPEADDPESTLQYATYLGGSGAEGEKAKTGEGLRAGLAADGSGRVYVGGTTTSGDFPTEGAEQDDNPDPDCPDEGADCNASAFLTVLDPQAADGELVYSSYFGGEGDDEAWDVAVAGAHLVMAGTSDSCDLATDGAYRDAPPPGLLPDSCGDDLFAARFHIPPQGRPSLAYASFLGAEPKEQVWVAADVAGRAFLAGTTPSDDHPVTDDAPQKEKAAGGELSDAFVTVLTSDGAALDFSTYRGGSHSDTGSAIAVDQDGDVVVGGRAQSDDFPVTDGAAQYEYPGGDVTGWLTRFTSQAHPLAPRIDAMSPDQGASVGGTTVAITGRRLGDTDEVRFGAAAVPCPSARCQVDSDHQLTVTAPPHPDGEDQAGEVAVTAVNDHGPSPSVDFLFSEGVWEQTASLDAARFGHTATVLPDGNVLIAGCQLPDRRTDDSLALLEESECPGHSQVYDPLDRSWSLVGAGEPSGPAALLNDGNPSECGVNCGKVLIVACPPGGLESQSHACSGDGGLYNPTTGVWEPAAPPAMPRQAASGARLSDGRVLTTGGRVPTTGDPVDSESSSELFDPLTGTWTPAANTAHPRSPFHTLTALPDGTALAVGGHREGDLVPPERFYPDADGDDPRVGAWRDAGDQRLRRFNGFTATLLTGGTVGRCGEDCGNVMIAGGSIDTLLVPTPKADVELYNPDGDTWQPTGSLDGSLTAHASTELPTGKVLVTGGVPKRGVGKTAATQVYDPVMRRWRTAGRMDAARGVVIESELHPPQARHTATVLSSDAYEFAADPDVCGLDCGKVLVVGGSGDASAELYTPAPVVTGVLPGEADAVGGATVTIEGTGFTHGVREVRFGGQTVDCTAPQDPGELPQSGGDCRVIDYSTLEVEVPAAAGALSVPVEVVTDAGFAAADEPFTYTGAPGRVDDLAAEATSSSEVTLSWSAVGQTGQFEPPAGEYVAVHSDEPIGDADDFDSASVLCGGVCDAFDPSPAAVGDALELTVGGLAADTTHHFAVAALDPDGRRGPVSDSVSATTLAGDGDGDDDLPGFDDDDGDGDGGDGGGDAPVAPLEGGVLRLAGADRIATAVAASREAFADDEAGAVVLARADVFADGLAGVPLAAAENAPLLLTGSGELDPRSQAELQRVLADGGEVFLLGGTAALSDAVEQQVAALGYAPTRLAGADRFATAVAIAEDGLGAPDRVLVTTGGVFADAVTAGAAGARHGAAVVLTAGDQLPAATADYLDRHQPGEQIAVGGPAARAVPDMAALVGATRFETAATVADALFAEPAAVGVATGLRFPDPLSGGAHIARYQGPMLLSGPDRLHPAAAGYLASRRAHLQSGVIYGGTAALSPAVENQLADALP